MFEPVGLQLCEIHLEAVAQHRVVQQRTQAVVARRGGRPQQVRLFAIVPRQHGQAQPEPGKVALADGGGVAELAIGTKHGVSLGHYVGGRSSNGRRNGQGWTVLRDRLRTWT
ncbi:hypothetical protein ACWY4P_53045 [Streptomyces sp. LZ34]